MNQVITNLLLQMALSGPVQSYLRAQVRKQKTLKSHKNAANLCKKEFFFHVLFKLSCWRER